MFLTKPILLVAFVSMFLLSGCESIFEKEDFIDLPLEDSMFDELSMYMELQQQAAKGKKYILERNR